MGHDGWVSSEVHGGKTTLILGVHFLCSFGVSMLSDQPLQATDHSFGRCLVGGFVHDNPDEVIATQMEDKLWDIKAQGASRLLGSKCCKDQNVVRR